MSRLQQSILHGISDGRGVRYCGGCEDWYPEDDWEREHQDCLDLLPGGDSP